MIDAHQLEVEVFPMNNSREPKMSFWLEPVVGLPLDERTI
jgi:hypothetical protein